MDSMNGEGNFLFSVNDVKNNEQSFSNEISISNNNKDNNFEDVSIIGYKTHVLDLNRIWCYDCLNKQRGVQHRLQK